MRSRRSPRPRCGCDSTGRSALPTSHHTRAVMIAATSGIASSSDRASADAPSLASSRLPPTCNTAAPRAGDIARQETERIVVYRRKRHRRHDFPLGRLRNVPALRRQRFRLLPAPFRRPVQAGRMSHRRRLPRPAARRRMHTRPPGRRPAAAANRRPH